MAKKGRGLDTLHLDFDWQGCGLGRRLLRVNGGEQRLVVQRLEVIQVAVDAQLLQDKRTRTS